jgi:hypothetical protein
LNEIIVSSTRKDTSLEKTFKLNIIVKLKTKLQVINYIAILLNNIKYKINTNAKILVVRDNSCYLKAYPDISLLIGIVDKTTFIKYYHEAKLEQIKGGKGISLTSVR